MKKHILLLFVMLISTASTMARPVAYCVEMMGSENCRFYYVRIFDDNETPGNDSDDTYLAGGWVTDCNPFQSEEPEDTTGLAKSCEVVVDITSVLHVRVKGKDGYKNTCNQYNVSVTDSSSGKLLAGGALFEEGCLPE